MAERIGLISDTHGLLREAARKALAGSDLIIHAGDIGKPEILDALRALAPVVAVRGNIETEPWASALEDPTRLAEGRRPTLRFTIGGHNEDEKHRAEDCEAGGGAGPVHAGFEFFFAR
jgi:predicted phosphodiesterase